MRGRVDGVWCLTPRTDSFSTGHTFPWPDVSSTPATSSNPGAFAALNNLGGASVLQAVPIGVLGNGAYQLPER